MGDAPRWSDTFPVAPVARRTGPRITNFDAIPPAVIQDCLRLERGLKSLEQRSVGAAALSLVAIGLSRFTHHRATGNWGEGMAYGTLRVVKEWFLPVSSPEKKSPPDRGTIALTGIAGLAMGASITWSSVHAILQEDYDRKCHNVNSVRIGDVESSKRHSNEFAAITPVGLPQSIMPTDAAVADVPFYEYPRAYSATPSRWFDGAVQFARQYPVVAAGAAALAVIAAGAAVYLSGGTALVAAAL